MIIVAKDNNTNILRSEIWKELRQLDELVQNITVTLPTGEKFSYHEECARWEGQCFVNDILNIDKIIGEVCGFLKRVGIFYIRKKSKIEGFIIQIVVPTLDMSEF